MRAWRRASISSSGRALPLLLADVRFSWRVSESGMEEERLKRSVDARSMGGRWGAILLPTKLHQTKRGDLIVFLLFLFGMQSAYQYHK